VTPIARPRGATGRRGSGAEGWTFTARSRRVNERDLLIAVPAGLYLVEIKGHPGRLENTGSTWKFRGPDRVRTISNPLHLNDLKSKELKDQLQWAARKLGTDTRTLPRVEPAVFLSAPDLDSRLDEVRRVRSYRSSESCFGPEQRQHEQTIGRPAGRPPDDAVVQAAERWVTGRRRRLASVTACGV
jgi:hypothetical protein